MGGAVPGRMGIIVVICAVIALAAAALLLGMGGSQPAPAAPAPPNQTPTPPPAAPAAQNASAAQPPPPAPVGPLLAVSNESIGQLLDDGLARGDARFEAEKGPYIYDINAYRWHLSPSDSDAPDLMPLRKNDLNVSYIRFPDSYIDSLRGYAFKTYQPQQLAGPMKLFGVAVFLGNSTPLDSFGTFDMTYDLHPERSQTLEGCTILNSTVFATPTGSNIKVYDFRCKIMYGASP